METQWSAAENVDHHGLPEFDLDNVSTYRSKQKFTRCYSKKPTKGIRIRSFNIIRVDPC